MCRGQFLSQYQLHNAIVYDVSDLLVDVPVGAMSVKKHDLLFLKFLR